MAIGNRQGEGVVLCSLVNAYSDLGETLRAIEYYEQYLAITLRSTTSGGKVTPYGI